MLLLARTKKSCIRVQTWRMHLVQCLTTKQAPLLLHLVSQGQIYHRTKTQVLLPFEVMLGILNILILSSQQFLSRHQIAIFRAIDCSKNIEYETVLHNVINQRYRLLFVHVVAKLAILFIQFFHTNEFCCTVACHLFEWPVTPSYLNWERANLQFELLKSIQKHNISLVELLNLYL